MISITNVPLVEQSAQGGWIHVSPSCHMTLHECITFECDLTSFQYRVNLSFFFCLCTMIEERFWRAFLFRAGCVAQRLTISSRWNARCCDFNVDTRLVTIKIICISWQSQEFPGFWTLNIANFVIGLSISSHSLYEETHSARIDNKMIKCSHGAQKCGDMMRGPICDLFGISRSLSLMLHTFTP